jgi:hypothetical protein
MRCARYSAIVFLSTLCAQDAAAARQIIIRSTEQCPECRITAELATSIGGVDGPGVVAGEQYVATRSANPERFYFAYYPANYEIQVYDERGRFVRSVGNRGRGPGEFASISRMAVANERLYVADSRLGRLTVLTLDGDLLHTQMLEGQVQSLVVLHDAVIYNAVIRTPERIGHPIHVSRVPDGSTRSFGYGGRPFRVDEPFAGSQRLALTDGNTLLSASRNAYEFAQFTLDGDLIQRYVREASWFRPGAVFTMPDPNSPPGPVLIDVAVDEEGLLWTLVAVAGEEWRQGLRQHGLPEGTGYDIEDFNMYFDTVVEVIDLERRQVVKRSRFDSYFPGFLGDGHVTSYSEDADGVPRINIIRLRLSY